MVNKDSIKNGKDIVCVYSLMGCLSREKTWKSDNEIDEINRAALSVFEVMRLIGFKQICALNYVISTFEV